MPHYVDLNISNHHVHLTQEHIFKLFGEGYELTRCKWLGAEGGEFAANETVTLVGPKGRIENIRVLGPARRYSQAELLRADCVKLGINAPVRDSGNLVDAAPIMLVGTKGEIGLEHGAIIAQRHIHLDTSEAAEWGMLEKKYVDVRVGGERGLTFHNVLLRIQDLDSSIMHVDTEEGNAAKLKNGDRVEIL